MPHPPSRDSGRDVQTASIVVASVAPDQGAEVTDLGTLGRRPCDLAHLLRQRPATGQDRVLVYDAGPGGAGPRP